MRDRAEPVVFGVVIYEGVEPIDIGGTVGVVSMARRVLPNVSSVVVAARPGPVRMAGGLTVLADHGFDDAPPCDVFIVCGGPGWRAQVEDPEMLAFVRELPRQSTASVCTGALILAAAGKLDGLRATTRRLAVGSEETSPLALLTRHAPQARAQPRAIVEDSGVVTSGGVSLAIDATLHLLGRIYGVEARDEVARVIEYDRAFEANRAALGHDVDRAHM
jgi:transcriptional regulator GlxA family with amidase domain